MSNFTLPKSIAQRFLVMPTNPEDATWECPTCGEVPPHAHTVEGVIHYGRRSLCPCQQEAKQRAEKEQIRREWTENQSKHTYSWLGSQWSDLTLRSKTFENFDARLQPQAYETARMYAAHPSGTLVLYGTYGTGKTHLLAAICQEALSYGTRSLFATAPDMFAAMKQRIGQHGDYYDLVERATKAELFVIDDIDKSKYSEFNEEIYFAIIDKRTKRDLPTAISTNRLDELTKFVGGAVCSRLQIGQIEVEMTGDDYRKGM